MERVVLNKRALIAGLLRPYLYRIPRGIGFLFFFFARAFVRFQPDSFSRIFSPLPRFFIHFFLFLFCRKISSGTRMLMHHANRVRWQHKNITPRFHNAYTSLHYRFQSPRPANSYRDKSWAKVWRWPVGRFIRKSLFDRVRIDEEWEQFIHLSFCWYIFIFFFFQKIFTRCTLSRPVIEFTNRETCSVITCLSLLYTVNV